MCVLICRVGESPALAANRDEHYTRPFSPPRLWVADTPFWAPRDDEEGGTWIGVNRHGLIAAITNRSTLTETPGRASRGHLVAGVLARPDAAAARDWLTRELRAGAHNPCQIVAIEADRSWLCRIDGPDFEFTELAPGIHVLSNLHEPGEIDFFLGADPTLDEMRLELADASPRLPRGYAVCKRAGWRGTVASALIEPGTRFWFAGGPPDETPYEPVPGYPGAGSSSSDSKSSSASSSSSSSSNSSAG